MSNIRLHLKFQQLHWLHGIGLSSDKDGGGFEENRTDLLRKTRTPEVTTKMNFWPVFLVSGSQSLRVKRPLNFSQFPYFKLVQRRSSRRYTRHERNGKGINTNPDVRALHMEIEKQ